jgi:hypothetical protein
MTEDGNVDRCEILSDRGLYASNRARSDRFIFAAGHFLRFVAPKNMDSYSLGNQGLGLRRLDHFARVFLRLNRRKHLLFKLYQLFVGHYLR